MKINWESNKCALVALGMTALVCSRSLFALFDDPEGPNLLVVAVAAMVVYVPAFVVYMWFASATVRSRILGALLVQITVAVVLYVFM